MKLAGPDPDVTEEAFVKLPKECLLEQVSAANAPSPDRACSNVRLFRRVQIPPVGDPSLEQTFAFFPRQALGFEVNRMRDSDEFPARKFAGSSLNHVLQRRSGYEGVHDGAIQRLRFLEVGNTLGLHAHAPAKIGRRTCSKRRVSP